MIRKDLSVIEILMKRKTQLYGDLGQSRSSSRNSKCKGPETGSRKAFFDFLFYDFRSFFATINILKA